MTLHAYPPLAPQEIAHLARQALVCLDDEQDRHVILCWMHGQTQRQAAATCPRMDGGVGLTYARVADIRHRAIRRLKWHMGLRYKAGPGNRLDCWWVKVGGDADAFAPMPDALEGGRSWK